MHSKELGRELCTNLKTLCTGKDVVTFMNSYSSLFCVLCRESDDNELDSLLVSVARVSFSTYVFIRQIFTVCLLCSSFLLG